MPAGDTHNRNYTGGHAFRITGQPGATLKVKAYTNYYEYAGLRFNYWYSTFIFAINEQQIGKFENVYYNSDNMADYSFDVIVYEYQNGSSSSGQSQYDKFNATTGTSSTYTFTLDDDGIIDFVFTD